MRQIGHWINGKEVPGGSGRRGPVYDPASGQQEAEVGLAGEQEAEAAVSAAKTGLRDWKTAPLGHRADVLFRFREILDRNRDELAAAITAEHGKVLEDSRGEVARGLENVDFACGLPHLLKGAHSRDVSHGVDVHTVLEPMGIVACITPFNFPVMVPLWMLANAIACGNSVILKPSEKDPSPALMLGQLMKDAGVPDGVMNVLQGDGVAADLLLRHPNVAAVSFVGSTAVARRVYQTGTAAGKRVQALGGAKNHLVVLPDADIDRAADAVVSAAFGSAGERCMAISVVVAVGGVGDRLAEAISARIADVAVGPGRDPRSQMGPLVTREHRARVTSYLAGAEAEGARMVVDGRRLRPAGPGFFIGCSLLDHVQPGMKVYDDEIFGPVLSMVRVERYEDAVDLVNSGPYGNGAAIFTNDGRMARQFEADAETGTIGVNVAIPVPVGFYSFGGWKASAFGDSPVYGSEGIRFYTRQKVVTSRWPGAAATAMDLAFPARAAVRG